MDKKQKGYVAIESLLKCLKSYGNPKLNQADVDSLLFFINDNGKISFDIFRDWYIRVAERIHADVFIPPSKRHEQLQNLQNNLIDMGEGQPGQIHQQQDTHSLYQQQPYKQQTYQSHQQQGSHVPKRRSLNNGYHSEGENLGNYH
eukprot:UN34669